MACRWDKLRARILSGRGQGHGNHYLPWLWVHRKNPSKKGNQVVMPLPGYTRGSHFFARVEWHIGLLCCYLRAYDIREQYPIWPFLHAHPLAEYDPMQTLGLPKMRGLLDIASEAGIRHGTEIGSSCVPYVATVDLSVTLNTQGVKKLAAISIKPYDAITNAEPTDRMIERLELERRYFAELGAHHVILDSSVLGRHAGGNLEYFSSGCKLPSEIDQNSLVMDFREYFTERAVITSINEAISFTSSRLRISPINASKLWRYVVWNRFVPIDISSQLRMDLPLRTIDPEAYRRLTAHLFGE